MSVLEILFTLQESIQILKDLSEFLTEEKHGSAKTSSGGSNPWHPGKTLNRTHSQTRFLGGTSLSPLKTIWILSERPKTKMKILNLTQ